MDLFAFGINHTTAPVDVRERVGFAPERLPTALQDLVSQQLRRGQPERGGGGGDARTYLAGG